MASSSSNIMAQRPICLACNSTKVTDWHCDICDIHLCDECTEEHICNDRKTVRTSTSTTEPEHEPETWQRTTKFKLIQCKTHKDYSYTNYCKKCYTLVCPACLSTTHQGHIVQLLDQYCVKKIKKLEEYKKTIEDYIIPKTTRKIQNLNALKTFHKEVYERERNKIKEHDRTLKELITQQSEKLMEELNKSLQRTMQNITDSTLKLEKLLNQLKARADIIHKSRKNDILEICQDMENTAEFINQCDTKVEFPTKTKIYFEGLCHKNELGHLSDSILDLALYTETFYKMDINLPIDSSCLGDLTTEGIVWIKGIEKSELMLVKPNEKLKIMIDFWEIVDISASPSQELFIAFQNEIQILSKDGKLRSFYKLPFKNSFVFAIHACQNGSIVVLQAKKPSFLGSLVDVFGHELPLSASILSSKGDVIIYMTLNETTFVCSLDRPHLIKISKYYNIRKNHQQILLSQYGQLKNFDNTGKDIWNYHTRGDMCDLTTTSLGYIIILSRNIGSFFEILNSNGECIINLSSTINIIRIRFKNDNEILALSNERVYIIRLPIAI